MNIDCNDYMKNVDDKTFTLLIADPPYGINGNSHRKNKSRGKIARSKNYHTALWDQSVPDDEYFDFIFKKTHQQLIFGGNYFTQITTPFKTPRRDNIDQWLKDYPKGWIAWDKCNGTTGFNDYELIWTSFDSMPSFVFKYMWNGFMQGISINDGHLQQPYKKYNEVRIHPTHKPINLYKFLFKYFSQWTDKILDTHLGGASSAIAAHSMQLDFTGCEIDNTYFAAAKKRYSDHTSQLTLL